MSRFFLLASLGQFPGEGGGRAIMDFKKKKDVKQADQKPVGKPVQAHWCRDHCPAIIYMLCPAIVATITNKLSFIYCVPLSLP